MGKFSTSVKSQGVQIRMGDGFAGIEAKTQVQVFDEVCAKYGEKPALHQKRIAPVRFIHSDYLTSIFAQLHSH